MTELHGCVFRKTSTPHKMKGKKTNRVYTIFEQFLVNFLTHGFMFISKRA